MTTKKTKKAPAPKRQPVADPEGQNQDRAGWARAAVQTFQNETGLGEDDGLDTAISDLLVDLAHLCDVEGLDFGHLLWRADGHYTEETNADALDDRIDGDTTYIDGAQFNRIDVGRAED